MKYLVWMMETAKLSAANAWALLRIYGEGQAVWRLTAKRAKEYVGLSASEEKAFDNKSLADAQMILGKCKGMNVRVMSIFDDDYPQRLKNIFDPPIILYIVGTLPDMSRGPAIAVVGQRKATAYGLAASERIGYGLSQAGYVVVSGMAKGIDGAAHVGALKGATPTVAVFGTAIDNIYPAENTGLYRQIIQTGAVISEYPPGKFTQKGYFPRRNRIISGLCLGTVVVEANLKSGSLITANLALDQGRDVYAVPGSINAQSSEGANDLIKKGAKLVSNAEDILAEYAGLYGIAAPKRHRSAPDLRKMPQEEAPQEPQETEIFEQSGDIVLDSITGKIHIDELVQKAGLPEYEVLFRLTMLELEGKIKEHPGKIFQRKA